MKLATLLGLALISAISATSFAANITASVDGRQVWLPECGGTVQINNGGNDNQLNVVFREVRNCSIVAFRDGREYKLDQQRFARGGSYTLLTAAQLRRGDYFTTIRLSSNSGYHSDSVSVSFAIVPGSSGHHHHHHRH